MYYKDNAQYTESEIKALHPNVSFSANTITELGYEVIFPTPQPTVTELQIAYQDGSEIDVKGNRVVKWTVADRFADYTDELGIVHTKAEQEASYIATRKVDKIKSLKAKFEGIATSKPRVATGLGYDVDGGRDNKDDFFSKWESMADIDVTTVRDADNQFHPNTTKVQMQTIYRAIVHNGELLLQWKWQKEIEISSCTTLTELDAVVF